MSGIEANEQFLAKVLLLSNDLSVSTTKTLFVDGADGEEVKRTGFPLPPRSAQILWNYFNRQCSRCERTFKLSGCQGVGCFRASNFSCLTPVNSSLPCENLLVDLSVWRFQKKDYGEADCAWVARGGEESVHKPWSFRVQDGGRVGGL